MAMRVGEAGVRVGDLVVWKHTPAMVAVVTRVTHDRAHMRWLTEEFAGVHVSWTLSMEFPPGYELVEGFRP